MAVREISPASLRLCGFALVFKQLFKFGEKYPRLVTEVEKCFKDGGRLAEFIRVRLGEVADD